MQEFSFDQCFQKLLFLSRLQKFLCHIGNLQKCSTNKAGSRNSYVMQEFSFDQCFQKLLFLSRLQKFLCHIGKLQSCSTNKAGSRNSYIIYEILNNMQKICIKKREIKEKEGKEETKIETERLFSLLYISLFLYFFISLFLYFSFSLFLFLSTSFIFDRGHVTDLLRYVFFLNPATSPSSKGQQISKQNCHAETSPKK